jgi:hypothetical protein
MKINNCLIFPCGNSCFPVLNLLIDQLMNHIHKIKRTLWVFMKENREKKPKEK